MESPTRYRTVGVCEHSTRWPTPPRSRANPNTVAVTSTPLYAVFPKHEYGGWMSRTQAVLPGGPRLSDYLSIGVIAQVYPIAAVREALASCGRGSRRRRDLPAEAMMYYVVALGLFRSVSAREVLRCLLEGLRWMSSDAALRVSGKSSISRARTRLGPAPFEALGAARVRPLADPATHGAWYRGRRLVAFDGSTLNVPDEAANRQAFGAPGASRGRAAFPQVRLTALVEVGTRAAFAWRAGAYAASEAAQAEALLPRLSAGMLVLADRGYCGFPLWRRATGTGADLLWRMKANLRLPVLERFGDGSYRSVLRGRGQDRRRSQGECPIRVVEYTLAGADSPIYRLATTSSTRPRRRRPRWPPCTTNAGKWRLPTTR